MLFLIENFLLLLFLLFLVLSLIVYVSINYKYYKIAETHKVFLLNKEIEAEKIASKKLKKVPKEIHYLSKKTEQKLQIIKVNVLDIDFTLKEIF